MGNKESKETSTDLTPEQIAVLKTNTNYKEEEIRHWHARFIRDCPTGRLDKKKFIEAYEEFYPGGKADNFCKHAFGTFDKNHDGSIDFDEFLISIAASSGADPDHRLGFAFDLYDSSNDGMIEQKELASLISAMYDLVGETDRSGDRDPKKRAADIMSKLDTNSDKRISKTEFINGCKNDPFIRDILSPKIQKLEHVM